MKKKILVVDDSPKNIETAKEFFKDNTEYEFVYAEDYKGAEELLDGCDALITDRSIPHITGETIQDYKVDEGVLDKLVYETNGYRLLVKARAMGLPVVMISSHGLKTGLIELADIQEAKETYEEINSLEAYAEGYFYTIWPIICRLGETTEWFEGLSKESKEVWEMGWVRLLKNMENNEVINETEIKIR